MIYLSLFAYDCWIILLKCSFPDLHIHATRSEIYLFFQMWDWLIIRALIFSRAVDQVIDVIFFKWIMICLVLWGYLHINILHRKILIRLWLFSWVLQNGTTAEVKKIVTTLNDGKVHSSDVVGISRPAFYRRCAYEMS